MGQLLLLLFQLKAGIKYVLVHSGTPKGDSRFVMNYELKIDISDNNLELKMTDKCG